MSTIGFLEAQAPDADAQRIFDEDVEELGYVMNVSKLWAYQPLTLTHLFDLMGEDEYIGAAYQKHITETATKIRGRYEFGPLDIHADGKVAFVVYMQNFYGKKPDGTDYVIRCRTTDGLEKTPKGWRMVHEHVSIALDDQSFLAIRGRKNWDDNADK